MKRMRFTAPLPRWSAMQACILTQRRTWCPACRNTGIDPGVASAARQPSSCAVAVPAPTPQHEGAVLECPSTLLKEFSGVLSVDVCDESFLGHWGAAGVRPGVLTTHICHLCGLLDLGACVHVNMRREGQILKDAHAPVTPYR